MNTRDYDKKIQGADCMSNNQLSRYISMTTSTLTSKKVQEELYPLYWSIKKTYAWTKSALPCLTTRAIIKRPTHFAYMMTNTIDS